MSRFVLKPYKHRPMPVEAYVGMNGSGKTALAVKNAIDMARGRKLYTNTPIFTDKCEVIMIDSLKDFDHMSDGHIFIDEVNSSAPARGTQTMPHEMGLKFSALRHYDLTLSYTSPSYDHTDIQIRRITQAVIAVKALYRVPVKGSLWPRTKLSYVNEYDMRAYVEDEITPGTPVVTRGFLWLPWLPLDAYDTNANVKMIADHLICPDCGGNIKKQYCLGHPEKNKTVKKQDIEPKPIKIEKPVLAELNT